MCLGQNLTCFWLVRGLRGKQSSIENTLNHNKTRFLSMLKIKLKIGM